MLEHILIFIESSIPRTELLNLLLQILNLNLRLHLRKASEAEVNNQVHHFINANWSPKLSVS